MKALHVRTAAWRLMLTFLLIGSCTGCTLKQKNPITDNTTRTKRTKIHSELSSSFEVRGKASLSDGKRHAHLSLRWKQEGTQYVIHLYGPLGSGTVRLSNADNPTLPVDLKQQAHPTKSTPSMPLKPCVHYQDMKGEVRSYGSAEALLEKECGWKLPISGLSWWLRGFPKPGEPARVVPDKTGLNTQIEQEGWRIEYLTYTIIKGQSYPHKIRLSRDKLLLKFVLRDWKPLDT